MPEDENWVKKKSIFKAIYLKLNMLTKKKKTFPIPAISIFFNHQHVNIDLEVQCSAGIGPYQSMTSVHWHWTWGFYCHNDTLQKTSGLLNMHGLQRARSGVGKWVHYY